MQSRHSTSSVGLKVYKPTTPGDEGTSEDATPGMPPCTSMVCHPKSRFAAHNPSLYLATSLRPIRVALLIISSCRLQRSHHHNQGELVVWAPIPAPDRGAAQNRWPQQSGEDYLLAPRRRRQAPVPSGKAPGSPHLSYKGFMKQLCAPLFPGSHLSCSE